MQNHRTFAAVVLLAAVCARSAGGVSIHIDYRYDTNGFFNPGTASGTKARAAVNAAADFFSSIIDDSLSEIAAPSGNNIWRQIITHPGTGQAEYTISSAANHAQEAGTGWTPANEYRNIGVLSNQVIIYAGATDLGSLGVGGTQFAAYGTPTFLSRIAQRLKPGNEYATWGGFVSFDRGASWHLDHTQPVARGTNDLYSTALHEIAHVLGLSTNSAAWSQFQSGSLFTGANATAAWKADDPAAPPSASGVPTASASDHHWKDNAGGAPSVRSKVIGTNQLQESAMDPTLTVGTRKLFTNVDGKALVDIGWNIPSSIFDVSTPNLPADFNDDGLVNGADLARWKTAIGANAQGDADGDGDSDGQDLLAWQRQVGTTPVISVAATVPEPSALWLAAWALAAWGRSRAWRRRQEGPSCPPPRTF